MKAKFYHLRDKQHRPLVTVCLLISGNSFARGISICSLNDNPCKKDGRDRAKGRAEAALKRGTTDLPILRDEAYDVLASVGTDDDPEKWLGFIPCKSAINPPLNHIEYKILQQHKKEAAAS